MEKHPFLYDLLLIFNTFQDHVTGIIPIPLFIQTTGRWQGSQPAC